ncbi:MAG: dTDP-4-dehydrorhamnose 3,5-epimerase [Azospirillaceae bacterium]
MQTETFDIAGPVLVTPRRFADARGFFSETYVRSRYGDAGIDAAFVQDNLAFSTDVDTIRALHFQHPPHAQAKLIQALRGAIVDAIVDLRRGSPSYGRSLAVLLSAENARQLYVPAGFAHGYRTVLPDTLVAYKVDDYYAPECEAGLPWDDPDLAIDWTAGGAAPPVGRPLLKPRDGSWPAFADYVSPFGPPESGEADR